MEKHRDLVSAYILYSESLILKMYINLNFCIVSRLIDQLPALNLSHLYVSLINIFFFLKPSLLVSARTSYIPVIIIYIFCHEILIYSLILSRFHLLYKNYLLHLKM